MVPGDLLGPFPSVVALDLPGWGEHVGGFFVHIIGGYVDGRQQAGKTPVSLSREGRKGIAPGARRCSRSTAVLLELAKRTETSP